jgi:hypothetical protein
MLINRALVGNALGKIPQNSKIKKTITYRNVQWNAMGVGLYKNYGVVWFGEIEDASEMKVCD